MGVLLDLRSELATSLDGLDVNVYKFIPGAASLPFAVILAGSPYIESGQTFGEHFARFEVWVAATSGDNDSETRQLDELTESAIAALAMDGWVIETISQPFNASTGTAAPVLTISLTVSTSVNLTTN